MTISHEMHDVVSGRTAVSRTRHRILFWTVLFLIAVLAFIWTLAATRKGEEGTLRALAHDETSVIDSPLASKLDRAVEVITDRTDVAVDRLTVFQSVSFEELARSLGDTAVSGRVDELTIVTARGQFTDLDARLRAGAEPPTGTLYIVAMDSSGTPVSVSLITEPYADTTLQRLEDAGEESTVTRGPGETWREATS